MHNYYLYNAGWKPLAQHLSYVEAERLAQSYWDCIIHNGKIVSKVIDRVTGQRLGTILLHSEEIQ